MNNLFILVGLKFLKDTKNNKQNSIIQIKVKVLLQVSGIYTHVRYGL